MTLVDNLRRWLEAEEGLAKFNFDDDEPEELIEQRLDARHKVLKETIKTEEGCLCDEAWMLEQIAKKIRCHQETILLDKQ